MKNMGVKNILFILVLAIVLVNVSLCVYYFLYTPNNATGLLSLGAMCAVIIGLPVLIGKKPRSPNFFFGLHRTLLFTIALLVVFFVSLLLCYGRFWFTSNNLMLLVFLLIAWIYSENSSREVIKLPALLGQKSRSPNFFFSL